ncbi:MAG: hypothetical protein B7Z75_09760 [Acidocella sp. 20-57-95]|nr:MAG: hypothetical protein B7Z75_09760 [Acidocella sp. 20-57-95]HQT65001.1 DUF177 domain-containing protein [Acidocella sp.]HQU04016.1 DUF177 domain-containing protein [Acidocella sp.]
MSDDMSQIFSRRMKLGGIGTNKVTRTITATSEECAALAALFGLPAIAALAGEFTVSHERAGVLAADLKLTARVTQECVVTLELFETTITEAAQLRFVPESKLGAGDVLDAETLEGPDEIPYAGEAIDLGAVLAEQLALALDPYPRKPGAALPEGFGEAAASGPFAALLPFKKPEV